ncbi:MAG TPA: M4 family metallopeptidase [Anaerolineaceae bacterium]|nr:M4 family metallopeptidase [Anaerolineaceae bacterium]
MSARPHLVKCILPPFILDHIASNGSDLQRARASQTQQQSAQFRAQRAAAATMQASKAPAAGAGKSRNVYTANSGTSLPGQLVRQEGGPPTGDPAADEAYDGAGLTYDLYWDVYQRNSVDNQGLRLDSTVHYDRGYDNAFWNGAQMVYGDGDEDLPPDQRLFNRFTISLDVIGHELTHGVTQYTANLAYQNQPGALNESMSDVFGSLVKQRSRGQDAASADWIIGEGLFTANVHGVGIRSMKAPGTAYDDPVLGKDPQPAHMSQYVNTTQDNGGVHINSGIPNHAFYQVATAIGGNAWEKAGQIWYVTLRDKLNPTSNFQAAADQTFAVAGSLFGQNSLEQQAVKDGWAAVGITVGGGGTPESPGCFAGLLKALGFRSVLL